MFYAPEVVPELSLVLAGRLFRFPGHLLYGLHDDPPWFRCQLRSYFSHYLDPPNIKTCILFMTSLSISRVFSIAVKK